MPASPFAVSGRVEAPPSRRDRSESPVRGERGEGASEAHVGGWGYTSPVIDRIAGVLLAVEPAALVVEVGGLGLWVEVTPGCAASFADQVGSPVRLLTHFLFSGQELVPRLFGFRTPEARALFHLLRGVSGVGPSVALRILGAQATPAEVAAAIAREDARGIKVKGVGPKIAKRVISELKEKVGGVLSVSLPGPAAPPVAAAATPSDRAVEEAYLALQGLEFDPVRARAILEQIRSDRADASAEELVREALLRA
ncbi:MAG: Holliday junction branch migration protein RuvA [Planctomycetota bacterium]|nr:MAG: Holliday junction branch migration protein RuvA [Planctomycetota bacterium]